MSEKWHNVCQRVDTCALAGAAAVVAAIPKGKILVNGPLWCYFYALRYLEHSDYTLGKRMTVSQPDNKAIVFGAEDFIDKAMDQLLQEEAPSLLLVESSCSLSLIGDDLQGIVGKFALPFPVIALDSGGFVGGFAEGYSKCCQSIIKALCTKEPKESLTVNLLGLSKFYYKGAADIAELRRLLTLAGYRVQAIPGGGSTVEDLSHMGRAALNIVCNEELGLSVAQYLANAYDQPYVVAPVPYGVQGTLEWLEAIHEALPAPRLELVKKEAQELQEYLQGAVNDLRSLWGALWFEQVVLAGPSSQMLSLGAALRLEALDTAQLFVVGQQQVKGSYAGFKKQVDGFHLQGQCDIVGLVESSSCLFMGSSSEANLLDRAGKRVYFLPIGRPLDHRAAFTMRPYMGLQGYGNLLEDLWNCFLQVQAP